MTAASYRILLVEDDPDDRLILEELLGEIDLWRPEVVWAVSYEEGVRQVVRESFDVALVDYRLGAKRGIDFIREPAVRNAGLPVIVLTSQSGKEVDLLATEAGAADFLPKQGLDAAVLERTVRYTIEDSRRHRTEARFQALIENSRDLITILEADGSLQYATPSLATLLGYTPGSLLGQDTLTLVHPEDRPRIRRELEDLAGSPGSSVRISYRVTHQDGSIRHFDAVAQNLLHDPLIQGVVVNAWDVTELRRTQERTRFQAALLDRVGQAVIAVDDRARVTYWNTAAEELTGFRADEVMGTAVMETVVAPESREAALAAREAGASGRRWDGEICLLSKDGNEIVTRATVTAGVHSDGTPGGRIIVAADVTELRRAEEERRAAAERVHFQAHLLDAVGQAVIATDLDGTIIYWNRAAEDLYGWTRDEAVGRAVIDVTPADANRERAQEIMRALRHGETWTGDFELARRDGSTFHALVTDAPILGDGGELIGIIGVSSDVTERRLLEEQLRQAQKMEAIGRLAGGVAHDFNNLLTAIKGHSDLLLEDLPEDSPWRDDVGQILRAGNRAAALTRQLLAFSRKQVLEERNIDLAVATREMESMLRRLVPERIELVVDGVDNCVVRADPNQLHQVVMNLVVNAADAIEDAGSVTIEIDRVSLDEDDVSAIPWHVEPGPYARLTVRDTGSGMTDETLEHIFEPFFSTKGEGRGTGLGLSTVYGIVKQSGGHVMVESEPGVGTTFRVLLPREQGPAEVVAAAERRKQADPVEGGIVLLVEDDASVRTVARRVLERAGYEVLEATNGREALDLTDRHQGEIDLVLSDVVMPEIGGAQLADRLHDRYPALRVVLSSGYSEAEVRGEIRSRGAGFLVKPFTPETLLRVVAETMKDARGSTEAPDERAV